MLACCLNFLEQIFDGCRHLLFAFCTYITIKIRCTKKVKEQMTGCFQKLLQKMAVASIVLFFCSDFSRVPCCTVQKKQVIRMPRLICIMFFVTQLAA